MEKSISIDDDDDDINSIPQLPDTSAGSSVSSQMEVNDCNDLLAYSLVLPQDITVAQPQEPQVIENKLNFVFYAQPLDNEESNINSKKEEEEKSESKDQELLIDLNEDDTTESNESEKLVEVVTLKSINDLEEDEQKTKKEEETLPTVSVTSTAQEKTLNNLIELNETLKKENTMNIFEEDENELNQLMMNHQNNHNDDENSNYTNSSNDQGNGSNYAGNSTEISFTSKVRKKYEALRTTNQTYGANNELTTVTINTINDVSSSSSSSGAQLDEENKRLLNNFLSIDEKQPRKSSPVPISPPPAINDEINSSNYIFNNNNNSNNDADNSMELLLNNGKNSKNQNKQKQQQQQSSKEKVFFQQTKSDQNNNKNTLPQKNIKIANSMDKWYKELKGHVLNEFENSRLQMMQEQQKLLIEEKERQTLEIIKLRKEIEFMKESLKQCERNTLKKDDIINNLSKAFEKMKEKNQLQKEMIEWKLNRLENIKESFTEKVAKKHYENRLKLKFFVHWQLYLVNRHKFKVEKACKKRAESVCLDLATKYEEKIKKLEEELKSSHLKIEKYKMALTKNEENVKKALMRGVCALNLEAMSIFNENQQQKEDSLLSDNNQLIKKPTVNSISTNSINKKSNTTPSPHRQVNREKIQLAKKVKSFCEASLNNLEEKQHQKKTPTEETIEPHNTEITKTDNINSNGIKFYNDLTRHHSLFLPTTTKTTSIDQQYKNNNLIKPPPTPPISSRLNSASSTSTGDSGINKMTTPHINNDNRYKTSSTITSSYKMKTTPQRSIIIEKHAQI